MCSMSAPALHTPLRRAEEVRKCRDGVDTFSLSWLSAAYRSPQVTCERARPLFLKACLFVVTQPGVWLTARRGCEPWPIRRGARTPSSL